MSNGFIRHNGTHTTPFEKIIGEVQATVIPSKYIEKIVIIYKNNSIVELSGDEINFPIPVNPQASDLGATSKLFKNVKDVKVHIKIGELEKDVSEMTNAFISQYFTK